MSIREDAKKIVKFILDILIEEGDLDATVSIRYEDLVEEINLKDSNYCRICCQYLHNLGFIKIIRNDNGTRIIELKAKSIDFLETTN